MAMDEALRPAAIAAAQRLRGAGRRVDLLLEPKKMKWVFKVRPCAVCMCTLIVWAQRQNACHGSSSQTLGRWGHGHGGAPSAHWHTVVAVSISLKGRDGCLAGQSGLRMGSMRYRMPVARLHSCLPRCCDAAGTTKPKGWARGFMRIEDPARRGVRRLCAAGVKFSTKVF